MSRKIKNKSQNIPISQEIVRQKIYFIRGCKLMLDSDLAELYQVETRTLIQAVKRNPGRFPEDFMFQLNDREWQFLRSQIVISKQGSGGRRYLPYVFTEQGVAMLSSVLASERAILVNVAIMRTFAHLGRMIESNAELRRMVEALRRKVSGHDHKIGLIFKAIRQLITEPEKPRRRIGFY